MYALEHVARSIQIGAEALIVMFTAYLDASGNERTSVITVAGFVARLTRWERFESEWKSLLPRRIKMFHMTDFASSKAGWESWKGKSQQRAVFFDKLVRCVMRNTNKGFGISLQLSHYRDFNTKFQLEESSGGPYSFACQAFFAEVMKWAARNRVDYRREILFVAEDGDTGQGEMLSRARQDGFNVIPQSKAAIRAFDACDLAGWKARTVVDDSLVKELHLADPSAEARTAATLKQLGTFVQLNALIDKDTIEEVCSSLGIPERLSLATPPTRVK